MTRLLALAAVLAGGCSEAPDGLGGVRASLEALIATCSESSGEVQVKRAGEELWSAVQVGSVFLPGDWVRTGPGARARIEFLEGGSVRLEGGAVAIVDALEPAEPGAPRPLLLAVESGVAHGHLGAGEAGRGMLLRLADGSQARVDAQDPADPLDLRVEAIGQATEVTVEDTAATLALAGQAQRLEPGVGAAVRRGRIAKLPLLAPPSPQAPANEARFVFEAGGLVRLSWEPVAGAAGHRVQISESRRFRTARARAAGEPDRFDFDPTRPGRYFWRVASRDVRGRLGAWSAVRSFHVEGERPRDLLVAPRDGARFGFAGAPPRIDLSWREEAGAGPYRVVVATSPDLGESVVTSELAQDAFLRLDHLGPGTYWWGVYREGPVPSPLFLRPRRLVVRRVDLSAPRAVREWGVE